MDGYLGGAKSVSCNSLGANTVEEWVCVRRTRKLVWTLYCIPGTWE